MMAELLRLEDVRMDFSRPAWLRRARRPLLALDGVTLAVPEFGTMGLVGESGCGKSTLARIAMGLVKPTSGSVRFEGRELHAPGQALRGGEIGAVFQDPSAALNPRKRVRDIVSLPLRLHSALPPQEIEKQTIALLDTVSLSPAQRFRDRFPHELSGGQRQRVVIARAIALRPRLVIADEPVSALDMSIRAQILEMLGELKTRYELTYLFITHDLAVARAICDEVAVLYLGRVAEVAPAAALYANPRHPYTRMLLEAIPRTNPTRARATPRRMIAGDIAPAENPPSGCRFHPRCRDAMEVCRSMQPASVRVGTSVVACHLYQAAGAAAPLDPQPRPQPDRA